MRSLASWHKEQQATLLEFAVAIILTRICFVVAVAGHPEVKAAAADAGVVQTLVQLLESEQAGRMAYEAAEVLTLLTSDNLEQQAVMAQDATLQVFTCKPSRPNVSTKMISFLALNFAQINESACLLGAQQ